MRSRPWRCRTGCRARGAIPVSSVSYTEFSGPSTSKSRRKLKRCWWCGAASCGATSAACAGASPFATAIVWRMPGELDLQLHRAVEVEVPEEAVLVVADGVDGAHDEPARTAHLGRERVHVEVLPEDAVVLLVHADRVGDRLTLAVLAGDRGVEVVDGAEAVATELERVHEREAPEAQLAGVEGVLPPVARARPRRRARPSR